MRTKIYIGGVSFAMSNDGLRALFAEVGVVESAALATDDGTGYSRGYGFVEMASAEAAAAAVKKLHRLEVDGRRLTVHLAAPSSGR
jgi:RNA recognition motif-containing protein